MSVPLGPIGMLCIQRTLNRGQKYGFVTGLGATTSDVLYAIITIFFLNFVLGFVEQYQFIIQLIGSLVIVFFGLWIYRSNPISHQLPIDKQDESVFSDYISSFALTLSNPLIIFVMIALFAQLEFLSVDSSLPTLVLGVASIVLGATLWWLVLTNLANIFRHRFNVRGLKVINHITGGIITALGLVGLISLFF